MSIKDKIAGWAHHARTEAEDRAPTTAEQRHRAADWGQMIIQVANLLHSIGSSLISRSYEDAEHATATAWDKGYEQHREDAARPGKDAADVTGHDAAGPAEQLRDFSDPIPDGAGEDLAAAFPDPYEHARDGEG